MGLARVDVVDLLGVAAWWVLGVGMRLEVGGWRLEVRGWRLEVGGLRLELAGWIV